VAEELWGRRDVGKKRKKVEVLKISGSKNGSGARNLIQMEKKGKK